MFQIVSVAIITALTAMFLRATKPDLSFAVTVCGGLILLLFSLDYVKDCISVFHDLIQLTGIEDSLLKIIVKMIGIGYLSEFTAQIVSDFGSPSIADKVIFCGKLVIFIYSVPILESLLKLMQSFLELM